MTGKKIAVLGTGIMGAPIARNLSRAGFNVRVWNRTRAKAEPLAADGATVCNSAAEAASGVDFVLTMLGDGAAVESAMTDDDGALPAMRSDAIWLQCATVGVEATDRLAQLAEKAGIAFVDAPVLGTKKPAEDAKLNILASGAAELEARCRPIFDAIGQKATWIGPVGCGSRLKLVMNSWVLAITASVAEALALAEGLGLDPELFLSTLAGSQMDTPYAHLKGEAMIKRAFAASFPTAGAAKDMGLIVDAARRAGVTADVAIAVHEKFVRAVSEGHGDDDMAAAYCVTAAP
ncbi:MAG: NAD(P)-dependent oxidoreductase [Acidothermaceae bacterium]